MTDRKVEAYVFNVPEHPYAVWREEDEHNPRMKFRQVRITPDEYAAYKRGEVTLTELDERSRNDD